jgi:hypothetical protein
MARPREGDITKTLIARHLNISYSQLMKWQRLGANIDCANIVPFMGWLSVNESDFYRKERKSITTLLDLCGSTGMTANDVAMKSIVDLSDQVQNGENIDDTLEALQIQIKGARDIDQARFLKMKVDALHSMRKYEVECGKYTSNDEIKDQSIKLGNIIKAMLNKYENDLPVACEGLTPAEMQIKIKDFNRSILETYSETIKGLTK